MPSHDLTRTEAQLALLAIQKKNVAQAAAQQAFNAAEQQFVADVTIITKFYEVPKDAAVNFHIEDGNGSVSWPDQPDQPEATV